MQFNDRVDEIRHFITLVQSVRGKINGDIELTRAYEAMGNLHDHVDSEGANLLHYSVFVNPPQTTQWLLDYGFDIDAQTTNGETALMLAVKNDQDEVVHVLLRANANIDLVDNNGETALDKYNISRWIDMFYLEKSSVPLALVMKLVDKCETEEEVALKLINFRCPLYLVLFLKNRKIMELLLELGVDPNLRERQNQISALHMAVYHQHSESVELLLQYGADVNSRNSYGYTPIGRMRQTSDQNAEELTILKLLLDRGAELTTQGGPAGFLQIFNVLRYGGGEAIRLVLQTNIDLCAKDEKGNTPLHYLAANKVTDREPGILELLHNRPLDVNAARHEDQWTALDFAIFSQNARAIQFLLEHGADVNAPKRGGMTCLFYAMMDISNSTDVLNCVELLLEYGADIQIVSAAGPKTIFHCALEVGTFGSVEPVLAYLAMHEASGTVIKNEIRMVIESHDRLVEPFNMYKRQLEELKKTVIIEPVTILQLLIASKRKVLLYLRNQEFVLNLEETGYKNKRGYYYKILRERLQIPFQTVQLQQRAAAVLCEIMKISYDSHPIIIDMIFSYLSEQDLQNFAELSNYCTN